MFDLYEEWGAWFYAIPFAVFAPIYFSFVWHIGLKSLFKPDLEKRERKRLMQEQQERVAQRRAEKAGARARVDHKATKPSWYWGIQGVVYALFIGIIGAFSAYPHYNYLGAGQAQIKLSLSHPAQRVEACVKYTREELDKLAPNMRAKMKCSRERQSIHLELDLDGKTIFSGTAEPAGLQRDGASSFYEKFFVSAGEHTLTVRMNDGDRTKDFNYVLTETVKLEPTQNLVVGFKENQNTFYFR